MSNITNKIQTQTKSCKIECNSSPKLRSILRYGNINRPSIESNLTRMTLQLQHTMVTGHLYAKLQDDLYLRTFDITQIA